MGAFCKNHVTFSNIWTEFFGFCIFRPKILINNCTCIWDENQGSDKTTEQEFNTYERGQAISREQPRKEYETEETKKKNKPQFTLFLFTLKNKAKRKKNTHTNAVVTLKKLSKTQQVARTEYSMVKNLKAHILLFRDKKKI